MNEALAKEKAGAEAYEALHVPALFQQWCARVLDSVAPEAGSRVLDVACGTGVLAREAIERVGENGRVAGVDPGRGMLAVAKDLCPEVEWREGVAESLPYPGGSFDVVASQFGMMFFTDRMQALREMHRVLAPGGKIAVAVWESLEDSEAYPEEVDMLERLAGTEAADALRAPFVLGDKNALHEMFESAGFRSVDVRTHMGAGRFPSVRTMVEADLRGWLPVMGVHLDEDLIQRILEDAEVVLREYVTDAGTVEFDSPAHIVTGERA